MLNRLSLLIVFLFTTLLSFAQVTQTIRGEIKDKDSKYGIPGAVVIVTGDSSNIKNAVTDVDGKFTIEDIPLGRKNIVVRLVGYSDISLSNVVVTAGKEVVLNLEMEEKVQSINEVVITAHKREEANNEMATLSAKAFVAEETERYAGSRSDPARMASNFAGVQGADDSRNDIVIRGNSPMGLLYRIEDIDIPNPNHFATPGTSGGAVSMLNNKTLGNSDFMTGAFPAEYGNALAGVFDIKLRNGNNHKYENTAQFGFLGTELNLEGPISKKSGSSYLLSYRYSTLKLFEAFNIKIGTSAVPSYQDATFKLNFPLANGGNISVFGIGGLSHINIKISDQGKPTDEIYGDKDRDQYFASSSGVIGTAYSKQLSEKTYTRLTLSYYKSYANAKHEKVFRNSATYAVDSLVPKLRYTFLQDRVSLAGALNHKFSSRSSLKAGGHLDYWMVDMHDSNYIEYAYKWEKRLDATGNTFMGQPYIQWKYKFSDKVVANAGVHAQYLQVSNSFAVEPRIGVKYYLSGTSSLGAAVGIHSQSHPLYVYYHEQFYNGAKALHNKSLDFSKSIHNIISYDKVLSAVLRLKIEAYYQYLYDIPVDISPSAFSLINQGSQFNRFFPSKLQNAGTGYNKGIEITIEKSYSKNYFVLATVSVFDSKYKGSNGVLHSTDYNGNYASNLLVGKEFLFGKEKKKTFVTGLKVTYSGGRRYTPADDAASILASELVELDSLRNTKQFHPYFRVDAKIGLKINQKKVTHELAIDFVNMLNTKNVLGLIYVLPTATNPGGLKEEYQLGFLPLFYYKIDF